MDLEFQASGLPSDQAIENVLINEAPKINEFSVQASTVCIGKCAKPTAAPTTTTAAPTTTTAAPTTTTPPTVEATITRKLTFRSRGETFTTDLLNPSSAAFKSRAALIKSYLEPLFQREFSTLRDFIVTSFSNGSIINNMNLKFSAAFAPSNIQIAEVLLKAASNVTTFNIDTGSILVDDTAVSSGVSHNISLITALSLVLLSWLLSNQQ
uniref:SEA domain-containing protein n=1 Tax=Poecilia formosa TaxID=48698 RepID=A0A087Y4B9_POEFO